MKKLRDLTADDFRESPVWRYEGGAGEEAVVEASPRQSLSREDDEIFLAATEFELADGSRHFGFCFPAEDSGLDYLQPVILTAGGSVSFWFDEPAPPETLVAQWSALGKTPSEIFPVTLRCLVPVDGRAVESRIESVEDPGEDAPLFAGDAAFVAESETPEEDVSRAPAARPVVVRPRGTSIVEKRTSRRRRTEMPVEFAQGPLSGTGVTGDVSRRGMFVRSRELPGTGPLLKLTVNLPGGRRLELKGRVVRRAGGSANLLGPRPAGFGLRLAEEWPEYESLFPDRRGKSD
jgi:hypothetical protein